MGVKSLYLIIIVVAVITLIIFVYWFGIKSPNLPPPDTTDLKEVKAITDALRVSDGKIYLTIPRNRNYFEKGSEIIFKIALRNKANSTSEESFLINITGIDEKSKQALIDKVISFEYPKTIKIAGKGTIALNSAKLTISENSDGPYTYMVIVCKGTPTIENECNLESQNYYTSDDFIVF